MYVLPLAMMTNYCTTYTVQLKHSVQYAAQQFYCGVSRANLFIHILSSHHMHSFVK